ncbi:MAG: hypothetical protein WHV63_10430 [Ignavibacteria bacterium]
MKTYLQQIILFIISVIVISNQLVLIQYFSYQQWYNFASVIISIALFGFGFSGLIIPKIRKETSEELNKTISNILILSGFYIPISLLIERNLIGSFDSYLIFFDLKETIKFFLIVINYSIPFCILATLIGLIFTTSSEKIGNLYFINLIGSGISGFLVINLLWIFEPQRIYLINGLMISLLVFLVNGKSIKGKFSYRFIANLFVIVFNLVFVFTSMESNASQFKTLSRFKNFPDAKIIEKRNSPYGKVEILRSSFIRYSPGLSLNFDKEIPPGEAIFLNAELAGFKINDSKNIDYHFLKNSTLYLPFIFKTLNKILILNSAGGVEINRGLASNARNIVVTEKNPILLKIISSQFKIYDQSKIQFVNEDTRIFIEKSDSKFDLIFHPVIEPVGYSSGLYSAQEKFLFTKEAFQKIYDRLNEGGYFSISCYIDNPLKTFPKLLNILTEIRDSKGDKINNKNLMAINNWNVITIVVKKGSFKEDEIQKAENFCFGNQFDILIHPFRKSSNYFNAVIDPQIFDLIEKALIGEKDVFNNYLFNLNPPTDDKPYFSNFINPQKLNFYLKQITMLNLAYSEVGYFLIWLALLVVFILASMITFAALKTIKISSKRLKVNVSIYFSLIGLAFMFIEISLIQKLTLVMSNDVFAISFVISLLLISSGTGSFWFQKHFNLAKKTQLFFFCIFLAQLLFLIFSDQLVRFLICQTDFQKYLLAGLIIFFLGFFMGMPFPYGIRKFSSRDKNIVPLAWAINGSFSVFGSSAAVILLITFGFKITFLVATLIYFSLGFLSSINK